MILRDNLNKNRMYNPNKKKQMLHELRRTFRNQN